VLISHKICKNEYDKNVNDFLADSRIVFPLNYESTALFSESFFPKERPVYIRERNLGSGLFGEINMVIEREYER
jgi:hypothetical protein